MTQWTRLSDQYPLDRKDYQLYCEDTGEQFVGFYADSPGEDRGRFQFGKAPGKQLLCKPSHWMPLPEPPQRGRE